MRLASLQLLVFSTLFQPLASSLLGVQFFSNGEKWKEMKPMTSDPQLVVFRCSTQKDIIHTVTAVLQSTACLWCATADLLPWDRQPQTSTQNIQKATEDIYILATISTADIAHLRLTNVACFCAKACMPKLVCSVYTLVVALYVWSCNEVSYLLLLLLPLLLSLLLFFIIISHSLGHLFIHSIHIRKGRDVNDYLFICEVCRTQLIYQRYSLSLMLKHRFALFSGFCCCTLHQFLLHGWHASLFAVAKQLIIQTLRTGVQIVSRFAFVCTSFLLEMANFLTFFRLKFSLTIS